VIAGVDLHGLRAVVTGASSGIGAETARVLATAGADVTLAVRDTTAGARVADRIAASAGEPRAAVAAIDLADPESAARFARDWDGPLHLLVNNAGLVTGGLERTKEGWELQFATNHLGHFAGMGAPRHPGPGRPGPGHRPDRVAEFHRPYARPG
jgi:NAD(P)-dependent dehydrogenase (short-subunit alcohol dehydrogenase family)